MTEHDINRYIGRRWVSGGHGPDVFDCWGLLAYIERVYFDRDIPEVLPEGAGETRGVYQDKLARSVWEVVTVPAHGDGVLLRGGDSPHVGIWLDVQGGGVLHAQRGIGVIWTRKADLRLQGYSRIKFHRFHV